MAIVTVNTWPGTTPGGTVIVIDDGGGTGTGGAKAIGSTSEVAKLETGAGGAGLRATLGLAEQGLKTACITKVFPTRSHTVAAQGGINAAKNYQNDGDSIYRLFYDTIKGGDYRSREANVYRLAEISNNIIDQCVAQGVPFAREYGGQLDNRSFGGAQVSRTFYAKGQTGLASQPTDL